MSCGVLADQTNCVANTARISILGRNGTDTNVTGTVAPTGGAVPVATMVTMTTMAPGNGTLPTTGSNTSTLPPPTTTTVTPTNQTGNVTVPPTDGDRPTASVAPTSGDSTVRIFVAWLVRNNANITDPQDVLDAGLADAFPAFVAQVVANLTATNLTATGTRQLMEYQTRRLETDLVSAAVYNVTLLTECGFENMTTNMTTTNATTSEYKTCHEAMGWYYLMLTSDEDPVAVRTKYTKATRDAIDDGTFQDVLLEIEPDSPLLLGPSIDAIPPNETLAPSPSAPSAPTIRPTCLPGSKSKSKGGKGKGKGSKGQAAAPQQHGSTKMMRPNSKAGYRRKLKGHEGGLESNKVQNHFENVLKKHDVGDYYTTEEWTEEEGEAEVDECEEPEIGDGKTSSKGKGKGKGGKGGEQLVDEPVGELVYHQHEHQAHPHSHPNGHVVHSHERYLQDHDEQRHLRDDLPRVQGTRRHKHRISDIHAEVAAELHITEHK
jgi:hypothetical protein